MIYMDWIKDWQNGPSEWTDEANYIIRCCFAWNEI